MTRTARTRSIRTAHNLSYGTRTIYQHDLSYGTHDLSFTALMIYRSTARMI